MITLKYVNSNICIYSHYDPQIVELIKTRFEDRKWSARLKCWIVPANEKNYEIAREEWPDAIYDSTIQQWWFDVVANKAINTCETNVLIHKIDSFQFKTEPYKHQYAAFRRFALSDNRSGGLFLEMGLGKSKVALDIAYFLLIHGIIKKILIVVPLSVVSTWREEIVKHTDINIEHAEFLVNMTGAKKIEILNGTAKTIYVVNYDSVSNMLIDLKLKEFDMLICDESTYIKSWKAQRTQAIHELAKDIKCKFALTGTPMGQRVMDIYSQVKLVAPEIFTESWFSFRNKYCEMTPTFIKNGRGGHVSLITGQKNMEDLYDRIARCSVIGRKKDCLDLPERIYETRTCQLDPEQEKIYHDLVEYLVAMITVDVALPVPSVLAQMMKLSQICSGFVMAEDKLHIFNNVPKLKLLEETLDELEGKVLIFCKFKHDIDMIKTLFREEEYVIYTGEQNEKEREEAIKNFNLLPCTRYFIATSAGGYGLNLQVANNIVFYSHEWSIEKREQQEARCHRSGQTKSVTIIDLVALRANGKQTIDGYVIKCCKEKKDINNNIVEAIKELM